MLLQLGSLPTRMQVAQYCAVLWLCARRIVLAQLEGSGRGALAAYNQSGYTVLSRQLQEVSLRDPDAWLDDLLKKDKGIGNKGAVERGFLTLGGGGGQHSPAQHISVWWR